MKNINRSRIASWDSDSIERCAEIGFALAILTFVQILWLGFNIWLFLFMSISLYAAEVFVKNIFIYNKSNVVSTVVIIISSVIVAWMLSPHCRYFFIPQEPSHFLAFLAILKIGTTLQLFWLAILFTFVAVKLSRVAEITTDFILKFRNRIRTTN